MEYIHDTDNFQFHNTTVTLGKFDGMHKGHQLIFDKINEFKAQGYNACVFSFDRPPIQALKHRDIQVIYTHEEKAKLFKDRNIDIYIEHPFTDEFSRLSPEDFVKKILIDKIGMKAMVVGDDCGFGYKRQGNVELLKRLSKELGFSLVVIPKLELHGSVISSTRVRNLIEAGEIENANELMVTPFMIYGLVVHGNQLGREVLGMPTANQVPGTEKILPPNGVYVSRITYQGKTYYGISNIGKKPTIEGHQQTGVETFIFDFDKNIYGKNIAVELLYFRRPEMKFDSLDSLGKQMHRDAEFGKKYAQEMLCQKDK